MANTTMARPPIARTTASSGSTPSWLVPILFLQMVTIMLFVIHEVFWDAGGIAPKVHESAFQPPPETMNLAFPPTAAPRGNAHERWLQPSKLHYSDIPQKHYDPVDCPNLPRPQIPTFVIAGTQKAGTSALYYLLKEHEHVVSSLRFETHFFDNASRRLQRTDAEDASNETICELYEEYRKEFPEKIPDHSVTFEKVPAYLCRPRVPAYLKRVAPWAKIVFILRNPIDRAHSSWKMEYNTPTKQMKGFRHFVDEEVKALRDLKLTLAPTWSEIVAGNLTSRDFRGRPPILERTGLTSGTPIRNAKIRNLHCGYLSRGMYAQQLIPWLEAFGREQILIVRHEEFETNQTKVLHEILDFVGVKVPLDIADEKLNHKFNPRNQVQRRKGRVGGDMREYLRRFYKPYNEELANLLGGEWRTVWN